jgi:hypothetical protein
MSKRDEDKKNMGQSRQRKAMGYLYYTVSAHYQHIKSLSRLSQPSYTLTLGIATYLFIHGITYPVEPANELLSLRLGSTDSRTMVSLDLSGFITTVIVANLPQLLLSGIYYSYNGLFTTFLLSHELNQYGSTRKGLRVSARPEQAQRSTRFLQLPYRYGIPLMIVSSLLHWLCSQSLFIVSIWRYPSEVASPMQTRPRGDRADWESVSLGYSPVAILCTIILGTVMLTALMLTGLRKFRNNMPIASSCSASISSLCHLPHHGDEDHREAPYLPLQWGVLPEVHDDSSTVTSVYCSFSSREVRTPTWEEMLSSRTRNLLDVD